jgi:hypothetical protein
MIRPAGLRERSSCSVRSYAFNTSVSNPITWLIRPWLRSAFAAGWGFKPMTSVDALFRKIDDGAPVSLLSEGAFGRTPRRAPLARW